LNPLDQPFVVLLLLLLQVLGHTKTILVLLTSWFVLHEHMSARKLFGMVLAVSGMVLYGYFNSSSFTSSSSSSSSNGESKPLLPVAGKLPAAASKDRLPRITSRDRLLSESTPLIRSANGMSARNSRSTQDLTAVLTAGAMAASTTQLRSGPQ
jgi:drug/metabolite transporter (DMT)-like permease